MKKKLLTMLFAVPFLANAQFSENFDSGLTLPAGWNVINGGDANTFQIGPASANSAYTNPNSIFIVYSSNAHDDYLVTPQFTVTAGVTDRLSYFVKNQDPSYVESYGVKLSMASNNTPADFTTILKDDGLAPNDWTNVTIDLTPYIGQTVYVGFHATGTDKFRLHFDDISVGTASSVAPGCVGLTAPANGAIGLDHNSVSFVWSAPTEGGSVDFYEFYLDTNPDPTTLRSSRNLAATVAGLQASTTYYWKVVAKNAVGSSVCSDVYSFTTKDDPIAPYCGGNLLYSNGIEPITSVQISDMTNVSPTPSATPHEAFVDKVATLEQGKTYPITLQGDTSGNYTSRFIVFIDWNQDGDFLDQGETYFDSTVVTLQNSTGADGKTAIGNIVVPADAPLGTTRMRIKKNYVSTSSTTAYLVNPCYSAGTLAAGVTTGYGQAEDYTINVVESGLSTSDVDKTSLAIYPNPVKDVLNITSSEAKVVLVEFYSANGSLVKQVSNNLQNIDVKDLSSGVYFVKVKTSASEKIFKVIKQ